MAKALWQAAAGERYVRGFTEFSLRKVGEAWLVTVGVPDREGTVFDGIAYFAFDSRDGGFFYGSRYHMPKDQDLIELLRRRRALLKRGIDERREPTPARERIML